MGRFSPGFALTRGMRVKAVWVGEGEKEKGCGMVSVVSIKVHQRFSTVSH